MSILHRLFGIDQTASEPDVEMKKIASDTIQRLERERQELRQTVQRVESGARVMENSLLRNWDGAMLMLMRQKNEQSSP